MAAATAIAAALLAKLGDEVEDVDEETFNIFSQPIPSQDLGMVDAQAFVLDISVGGRDFEITQSPGILRSTRAGGTTGAAVWRTSIAFAEWMASRDNSLFKEGVLDSSSTVLELGAGISGILPCLLSQQVQKFIATDQSYILKFLQDNIATHMTTLSGKRSLSRKHSNTSPTNIEVFPLDWENDDISSVLSVKGVVSGVDAIVVCDCVFNYALIAPLVQTCVDICNLRRTSDETGPTRPTVCIVAQQLRQPEVFEEWLTTFHQHFRVWRLSDVAISAHMREGTGFAVHLGILRD